MKALSKKATLVLEALRVMAQPESCEHNGQTFRKVFISPTHRAQGQTNREFRWHLSALEHAGLLIDWPGDDRFAAVAVETDPNAEPPRDVNYDCDPIADQRMDACDFVQA